VYRSNFNKSFGASVRCLKDWLLVYLTICGWANAGGKRGVWGEFPSMGRVYFIIFKNKSSWDE
jgi:hypothetical protein